MGQCQKLRIWSCGVGDYLITPAVFWGSRNTSRQTKCLENCLVLRMKLSQKKDKSLALRLFCNSLFTFQFLPPFLLPPCSYCFRSDANRCSYGGRLYVHTHTHLIAMFRMLALIVMLSHTFVEFTGVHILDFD